MHQITVDDCCCKHQLKFDDWFVIKMFYITGNVLETSMKITTPPRITGEHWTLSGWRALLKFMTRTCTDVWLLHLFTSLFILMLFEGFLDFESCENWYCYVITTWRLTFSFFSENLPGVMPLSLSLKITCFWERQKYKSCVTEAWMHWYR